MKPISPSEVAEFKASSIPEAVIAAFNELIALSFDGKTSSVMQDDVIKLARKNFEKRGTSPVPSGEEIFRNHWLDVEEVYKSAGWRVTYDKPGYNETYPASFAFTKKR